MAFFLLSTAFIAMVAANGYGPAADNTYVAAPAPYPSSGNAVYFDNDDYSNESHDRSKKSFRKLKDLKVTGVFDADIRYYKHDGDYYAEISCTQTASKYIWILADSDTTIPTFGLAGTVALAGGVNVQYVAKYKNHGKWTGHDFEKDDKHKFRRVGCYTGTLVSELTEGPMDT
ncbi:hypothetical protein GCK72_025133 [Caenorhabditis remanei]|uniref:Uncharacterized protein n=1 Tax=Caenorhabditis remanei TaxID=31234 RepID=A0A6A5G141_CAERE|nr:hypothetical protein GCK72_025133 [Caenorhabditis remanei]KAF1748666.1 hypothetical protein GCK72_025133 [Caenorhabditis remanei]